MGPFDDLVLYSTNPDYMSDIEKEDIYEECLYEDDEF